MNEGEYIDCHERDSAFPKFHHKFLQISLVYFPKKVCEAETAILGLKFQNFRRKRARFHHDAKLISDKSKLEIGRSD